MAERGEGKKYVLVRTVYGEMYVLKRETFAQMPRIGEVVLESDDMYQLMMFKNLTTEN